MLKKAKIGEGKTILKKFFKPFVKFMLFPISENWLCYKIDELAKRYDFERSEYIGGVVWGYGPCERINKKGFMTPMKMKFEGIEFNVPSNYDEYLSGLYGDYMALPPEDKRVTHNMVVYYSIK